MAHPAHDAGDGARDLLRHTLATLAYRGAKAVRDAPDDFATLRVGGQEVARFFRAAQALDDQLASSAALGAPAGQLFQGPIADALTHVGQLTMLRRLGGHPVRGENYARAHIMAGHVGAQQPAAVVEFD